MEITWYGHSCFRITERGKASVITDPYSASIGLPEPKLKGDIVTISHDKPGHNAIEVVKGHNYVLRGPGEYEIGGVFITGIAMHNLDNGVAEPNIAYLIEYDQLNVLHLGDLAHLPSQSMVEELGAVNVLLVPVGGGRGLRASEAAEVIALIEPNYIIPMHYALPGIQLTLDPLDKFTKAMGVSKVQEGEMLKISGTELPEQPQIVVLTPNISQ